MEKKKKKKRKRRNRKADAKTRDGMYCKLLKNEGHEGPRTKPHSGAKAQERLDGRIWKKANDIWGKR